MMRVLLVALALLALVVEKTFGSVPDGYPVAFTVASSGAVSVSEDLMWSDEAFGWVGPSGSELFYSPDFPDHPFQFELDNGVDSWDSAPFLWSSGTVDLSSLTWTESGTGGSATINGTFPVPELVPAAYCPAVALWLLLSRRSSIRTRMSRCR